MIAKARNLNEINRQILIAYLHLLHMHEHLAHARAWDWAYRTLQAHWVRAEIRAHWVSV